jgi:hypothetical protein
MPIASPKPRRLVLTRLGKTLQKQILAFSTIRVFVSYFYFGICLGSWRA